MVRLPSLKPVQKILARVTRALTPLYTLFKKLPFWLQVVCAVILVIALFVGLSALMKVFGPKDAADSSIPTVTLAPVAELSGGGASVGVIGTVRSITEASILAQSGGTVTAVNARLGGSVLAGSVLAQLENASQRASVLQAEGAYDAAIAARQGASPADIAQNARNTYNAAYSSLDSILENYVDTFYGEPGPQGPVFLISPAPFEFDHFAPKRAALKLKMDAWQTHLAGSTTADPQTLLAEADANVREANSLITDIASAATKYNGDANATQLAAIASARTSIATLQATITAAKQAYQSQGTGASAGADASVKTALGSLRAAQANLEKTLVRAPIGGQVNFLPIRVGDYVTPLQHVATVAQNGALEVIAYVSEDNRAQLSVGTKVKIENDFDGIVTSISPALDPVTKQVEVHVAVSGTSKLVNGQSVRVALPSAAPASITATGPLLLPLTALKLTPSARVVFSIGEDGRLVSHAVQIGDVRGDRIEITSELPGDLRIVTDARGLSDGQKVKVATTP